MRHMWDAVDVSGIPADIPTTDLVAGYVNGHYANMGALIARFPNHQHVSIAVTADATALVLDVETYDATPDQAPGWARRMRQAGLVPTIYCNSSTWPSVRAAFHNQATPEPLWWIAQYDNVPSLFDGTVAKQYQNTAHYDLSIVADHWPGIDPEDNMPLTDQDKDDIAARAAVRVWDTIINNDAGALTAGTHLGRANVYSDLDRKAIAQVQATLAEILAKLQAKP